MNHPTEPMVVPWGGRGSIDIDVELVPVMKLVWAAGIETVGSCQGYPTLARWGDALVCFREPRWLCDSDEWMIAPGVDHRDWEAVTDAWEAARPSGARQLYDLLDAAVPTDAIPWHRMWEWDWRHDTCSGSSVRLPNRDLPMLVELLCRAAGCTSLP